MSRILRFVVVVSIFAVVVGVPFYSRAQGLLGLSGSGLENFLSLGSDFASGNNEQYLRSAVDKSRSESKKENQEENQSHEQKEYQSSRLEMDYIERLKTVFLKDDKSKAKQKAEEAERLEKQAKENKNYKKSGQPESKPPLLKQFGYKTLAGLDRPSTENRPFGGVIEDYLLGPGDELVVTFRGEKSMTYRVRVDTEGRIILPELKPLVVSGRTFGDIRNSIERLVGESYMKTDVFVSLGEIKNISVLVSGEVNRPGLHYLSGLSSFMDVFAKAGGVKKTGSLRKIKLVRNGRTQVIDLYNLLVNSNPERNIVLADGDRIIIPVLGNTVAVLGDVKRPAIYETGHKDDPLSVKDALKLAGGTLRSSGYRMIHIKTDPSGYDIVQEIESSAKLHLANSDILLLVRRKSARIGSVTLEGHVTVPGLRSLEASPTVGSIVKDIGIFLDNPYLPFAVLQRRDDRTLARQFLPINLRAAMTNSADIALHEGDRLIILGMKDIRYLASADVQSILHGKTPPSVIRKIGDKASKYSQSTNLSSPEELLKKFNTSATTANKSEIESRMQGDLKKQVYIDAWENVVVCPALKALSALDETSYQDRFASARIYQTKTMDEQLRNIQECPDIYWRYPDLLPFLLNFVVAANGEIVTPGIYPVMENTPLSSIVAISGGMTREADLTNIELNKLDSSDGDLLRSTINARQVSLEDIALSPGDTVRFNQEYSAREKGAVLLSGEFRQPGIYSIHRGEKLSEVIARAGGLTNEAYSYGVVFTREAVRKKEKEILKIAMNDMQSSFMHSLASAQLKDISATAVVAVLHELQAIMANADALGRIVVEADPANLTISPELDVVMQPGDKIYMPKRPNHVMVSGEVLHGGALQYRPGTDPDKYIEMAGGYKESADDDRIYMVMPNGTARPLSLGMWNFRSYNIAPGSTIMVPRDTAPINAMVFTKDVLDILSKAAVTAASIYVLNDND